jgi:alpha-L-fucosidase
MKHLLCVLLTLPLLASDPHQAERFRRFNEAKFGMFIHWGPYSQASVEASWPIMTPNAKWGISEPEYVGLAKTFNPEKFDAAAYVKLARDAGMRYMVFTSKHHDGFAMYDSMYTDYKITNSPYKRDIAAQFVAAAKADNMPFGFYYSPPDLRHPGYRDTSKLSKDTWHGQPERPEWPLYLAFMELQLKELLTRYGDIFVIWFDGLDRQEKYDGRRFHSLIHDLQPLTLINNRIGLTGDYVTPEQRLPRAIPTKGARVGSVEDKDEGLSIAPPKPQDFQPWETCMTINDTWAYNKNDLKYKSATELIHGLIDAAAKGGNFLLNIGPGPDGTVQPEFVERLSAMGEWLRVNGESIYGTTYGPIQGLNGVRTTASGNTVYVQVIDWPDGDLQLPVLARKAIRVRQLGGPSNVGFRQTGQGVAIETKALRPMTHATVFAIETAP